MTTETQPTIQPKDGDVFRFVYSQESWSRAKSGFGHGDLNWCFDGQLVFKDGRLHDTYWSHDLRSFPGDCGRSFTAIEACAAGELTFVCNLAEVEKIHAEDYELYADGDAFNLTHHAGYRKHFVKRVGAKRDKSRQIAAVQRKVSEAQADVRRAVSRLEYAVQWREQLMPRIEAGEEPSI